MTALAAAAALRQPPSPGIAVPELVIAVLFFLLGVRSLVRWLRTEFAARNTGESALYAVHVAARVGLWFAFGGFFLGLAIVDEPSRFAWFLLFPLALAGVQLVTAVVLGQGGRGNPPPNR